MFPFNLFKKKYKKIGLVLGGGGSRGFYHIGVIKALQELNIKIERISGTSVGAIMGAIYASNPNVDFDDLVEQLDLIKITGMILSHIDKSNKSKLEDLFKKYITARDFKDFVIPFSFNAVDVNDAKEVIFNKGNIFPEIFSSMSIPGIFPPLKYDGKYLIDGGVLNNIPINCVEKYCDKIIVSDLSTNIDINEKSNNLDVFRAFMSIAQKTNSLGDIERVKNMRNKKVIILRLKDNKTSILDFRKKNYKKLIEEGYNDTMNIKDDILNN